MTIPAVSRFDDFRFGLYDLSDGSQAVLNPESVIDPQFETVPGVGSDRLRNCTFNIPWYENVREAFDFDHLQLLGIDRYSDPDLMLWGMALKPKEGYSKRVRRDSIQVQVVQVEELLKARKVFQYVDSANEPISFTNEYPDDIAKELVRRCFSGADGDGQSRAWEWGSLVVEADTSQCADPISLTILSGPEQEDTLYKHLDELARTYDFDFQLKVTRSGGAWTFTFCTQAPYGGSDLTSGDDRVTIKDIYNLVPSASRYRDAAFRATRMYTIGYEDSVDDAQAITDWGLWEGMTEGMQVSQAEIALEKARVKKGAEYGFECTGANGMVLWLRDFKAGDTVNRINNRLGIEGDSEKIAGVQARFRKKVLQLTIRWGDREPASKDRQRGGEYNPGDGGNGQIVKDALPVGNIASAGEDPTHRVHGDHIHPLNITADDASAMTLTAGVGYIIGSGGIVTGIDANGKLVVDGSSLAPVAHTHAHTTLTNVAEDQHHAAFVGLMDDDGDPAVPDASNYISILGSGGITTNAGANSITIDGSAFSQTSHTHAHSALTGVSEDQHHAAFVGLKGDASTLVGPDVDNAVRVYSLDTDTYGFTEDAPNNRIGFDGPWKRFDAGSSTMTLRPVEYADDLRLMADGSTPVIWLNGGDGMAHFANDVTIGGDVQPSTASPHYKLHIYDANETRDFAGFSADAGGGIVSFGASGDGIAVMQTHGTDKSLAFIVAGTEVAHAHGDASRWTFRQGIFVEGYVGDATGSAKWQLDCSTGDLYLDSAATTTLGGYELTWPLTGAAAGDVLSVGSISLSAINLAWAEGIYGTPGTLTAATTNVSGDNHTHTITASAAPGSAASLLKTDASGHLRLEQLFIDDTDKYIKSDGGGQLQLWAAGASSSIAMRIGSTAVFFNGSALMGYAASTLDVGSPSYKWRKGYFSDYVYAMGIYLDAYGAWTGNWTAYGTISYGTAVVNPSGQPLYYDASGHVTTTASGNTGIMMQTRPHKHALV